MPQQAKLPNTYKNTKLRLLKTNTGDISQVLNKLPENGILNAETCRSEKDN
jgi:hypothetical protein